LPNRNKELEQIQQGAYNYNARGLGCGIFCNVHPLTQYLTCICSKSAGGTTKPTNNSWLVRHSNYL